MDDETSFGYWLRRHRKALDLTQDQLARRVACALITIQKLEADERRPSPHLAERLMTILEVLPEERTAFSTMSRTGQERPTVPRLQRCNNLPVAATPLIGRTPELASVRMLMHQPEVRLLTLTGPGGIGKTRVALQVAADLLDAFADGVYFVDLAPIGDPRLVPTAIAHTLGVTEVGRQPISERLTTFLRDKHVLLVLDNFEHLLAAAVYVADILRTGHQLKVLATSRAPLQIQGEHEFAVPPLVLPTASSAVGTEQVTRSEAGALFIARVQAIMRDFSVTTANAPAIAALCTRLDGLPLAIELAARRCKVFPPEALLARLDHRLEVLTGGTHDLPARQQTLRATIDWSYHLLTTAEQRLFGRLAVFVGGCTIAAAEVVCTTTSDQRMEVVTGIQALLDQSLLCPDERAADKPAAEARVTMLETIREYAREVLEASGEAERMRRRHAAYYLELAETASPSLVGPDQLAWLARLDVEHDNLRAALVWSRDTIGASELGVRLAVALRRFWWVRGYLSEGLNWLNVVLAASEAAGLSAAQGTLRVRALTGAGSLAHAQGNFAAAQALYDESLEASRATRDRCGIAEALGGLGGMAAFRGDYVRASAAFEESLLLYRELDDHVGIAGALNNLGYATVLGGNYEQAIALYRESLALCRALGDAGGSSWALRNLAHVAHDQGDYRGAAALYQESLDLCRELGDKSGIAWALSNLGHVADDQGDYRGAAVLYQESLDLCRDLGNKESIAWALLKQGDAAEHQGDYAGAVPVLEESLALFRDLQDKIGLAWTLDSLGWAALVQGDYTRTRPLLYESLELFLDLGNRRHIAYSLEGVAGLSGALSGAGAAGWKQAAARRAARLFGAAAAFHDASGDPRLAVWRHPTAVRLPPVDYTRSDPYLATARAEVDEAVWAAAWAEGRAMTLEQAVAYALTGAASSLV